MSERWELTSFRFGAPESVDREAEVLHGVAVVTEGPTNDGRYTLNSEFLDRVIEDGNALSMGAKVRFGHPNMCGTALGTAVGRAKNFRRDGKIARADIQLLETSHSAPSGDLGAYIMELADEAPDMFGTSIAFELGKLDEQPEGHEGPPIALMNRLLAVDVVDDPAANTGLYGEQFSADTLAGQVTVFLDEHPEVMDILANKPEIVDEFLGRYREYRTRRQGDSEMNEEQVKQEIEKVSAELRSELDALVEEFGMEIGYEVFRTGAGREKAVELKAEKAQAELEALKVENEALKAKVSTHDGEDTGVEGDSREELSSEVNIPAEVAKLKAEGISGSEAWRRVQTQFPDAYSKHIFGE